MSVIRHETFVYLAIACDEPGCKLHFSGSGDSADDVRDQAVTSGWIVMTDLTGEKQWHFCPRHAKAGLSARPVEPSESPSTT